MRFYLPVLMLLFCLILPNKNSLAAVFHPQKTNHTEQSVVTESTTKDKVMSKSEARKAKRAERKALKKNLMAQLKEQRKSGSSADIELILLIVLALFLPPLAMFIYDREASGRFWISLGLLLLAIPLWGRLGALAVLASVVYTLYTIISESI